MDYSMWVLIAIGVVCAAYLILRHIKSKRKYVTARKGVNVSTAEDPFQGIELPLAELSHPEHDDDVDESEVMNPICRIKGHDFEDSEPEVFMMPRNEMAWLMGRQPTYRRYRRCKREGCTKRLTQLRTNIVTEGPWKDTR